MEIPMIIQGGMGVAVSNWRLAKAASRNGALGVVSGVALAVVLARELQEGDRDGNLRRAMKTFPFPGWAERTVNEYYVAGGIPRGRSFKPLPVWSLSPPPFLEALTVLAAYTYIWLAKEGHSNPVGINLLEKMQMIIPASLYGAMLAGVDYVLVGAGVPGQIPGVLDSICNRDTLVRYQLYVEDELEGVKHHSTLNPTKLFGDRASNVVFKRPLFLPIVASDSLASRLVARLPGKIDGFVVEGEPAGGHSARPRRVPGGPLLNERGEPVYGDRDLPKLGEFRKLGLPFWLAGGMTSPSSRKWAREQGASGVQLGSAFALSEPSGIVLEYKMEAIRQILDGSLIVLADPNASPTGFPFKVVQMAGTLSDSDVYLRRKRVCDLGYLRGLYSDKDGKVGFRCPAEPTESFIKKGGCSGCTATRCLCNSLAATVGLGNRWTNDDGVVIKEPAIMTLGRPDKDSFLKALVPSGCAPYSVESLMGYLSEK